MLSKTIQKFLDANKVKYEAIEHKTVYTAFDKAATLHLKPAQIAKTVVVVFDGGIYALGVIAANKNLDKKKLIAAINKGIEGAGTYPYKKVDFASEKWMKNHIKGVDLGATPPFGTMFKYNLKKNCKTDLIFFIDKALAKQPKIIINGGRYETSLKITPAALIKINEEAVRGSFSMAKK